MLGSFEVRSRLIGKDEVRDAQPHGIIDFGKPVPEEGVAIMQLFSNLHIASQQRQPSVLTKTIKYLDKE